jgi:hypothetical protein
MHAFVFSIQAIADPSIQLTRTVCCHCTGSGLFLVKRTPSQQKAGGGMIQGTESTGEQQDSLQGQAWAQQHRCCCCLLLCLVALSGTAETAAAVVSVCCC